MEKNNESTNARVPSRDNLHFSMKSEPVYGVFCFHYTGAFFYYYE